MEKEKIWTKSFIVIVFANMFNNVGVQMLMPTIPLYLVALGATESQVGLVATSFFVSSILTRFFISVLLQRIGKKLTLFSGVLLTAVVIALYGLTHSVGAAAAMRIAQGLGFGTTTTIFTALAADHLPDSRRGEGIGYFSMGVVFAMTVAPAIGLFMRDNYGFHPMFFVAAAFSFISAVGVRFFMKPSPVNTTAPENVEKEENEAETGFLSKLYDPKLTLPALLLILLGLCRSADMNFVALFAEARNLEHLALYFAIQTTTSFGIRFFTGQVSDRRGRNWVLIPGGCAVLASLTLLSFAKTTGLFLLSSFFNGLGVGVLVPGMQVWMFSRVGSEKRNVASATYFNFYDVGVSIGAILLGYLAEYVGYTAMYRTAACSAVLYLIFYVLVGRERRGRAERAREL